MSDMTKGLRMRCRNKEIITCGIRIVRSRIQTRHVTWMHRTPGDVARPNSSPDESGRPHVIIFRRNKIVYDIITNHN